MEKEARQHDEHRRFNRQRPEAVRIRMEERQAIETRQPPQHADEHDQGADRRNGDRTPGARRAEGVLAGAS
ncbi:MAG: hypothetical protein LC674_01520 [Actinobacteria bacterium]|nr:hypothetical protein [Actinomycetota bacterium]